MGFTMSSTMSSTPAAYLIQLWPVTCCLETACLSHVVIVPTPPLKNTIRQDHNMIQLRIQSTPPCVLARTWYAGATTYRRKLSPPRLMRSLEHDTLELQYTGRNWVHPTSCSLEHDTLGLQPTAEIRSTFCNTLGLIGFGAKEAWSWSVLRRINGELKSLPISYRRKLCLSLQKTSNTINDVTWHHSNINSDITVTSLWYIVYVCSHWTQLVCRGLVLYVPRLLLFHTLVGNETTVVAKIIIFVASFWLVDLV